MVLEILGHRLAAVKTLLDFCMSYVATHDNGTVERQTGGDGVFGELGKHFVHGTVEIDCHNIALAFLAVFLGDELAGVCIEFLNPQTLGIDFSLHITVGRARYAETYGA